MERSYVFDVLKFNDLSADELGRPVLWFTGWDEEGNEVEVEVKNFDLDALAKVSDF